MIEQLGLQMEINKNFITGSKEHIALSRKVATEGMVLLKNEEILPLKKGCRVAIFGKAQIDYVKGGGGSGDVNCAYTRNIYQGFKIKEEEQKVEIFHKLSKFYEESLALSTIDMDLQSGQLPEPEVPIKLFQEAAAFAEVAIITICRFSQEWLDRVSEKGDFYLSDAEQSMVEQVCAHFNQVVVVLNVGGMVDTEWFKNESRIQGAILGWNAGMEGGLAVADIITGDVNPSGKLVDTFAKSFSDYPSSAHFHDSEMFVKYYEDIYVGYRYFETIPGANEKVNYPFGYGLSYTDFSISKPKVMFDDEKINIEVTVTNIGERPGREVVQVYYSAPQGKLGKAAKELAAFQKTSLLSPEESERICMQFPINQMASYDDLGKWKKSAYILEQGCYEFHVGNSVWNTEKAEASYQVTEPYKVVEQLTEKMAPFYLEKRLCSDGTYEEMPNNIRKKKEYELYPILQPNSSKGRIMFSEVAEGKATLDEFVAQLDDDYLIDLLGGKSSLGVANTGGIGGKPFQEGCDEYGVPCVMTCDGPAGVRIKKECEIPTTAFPCATLLACTWDTDLVYEVGRTGALEALENNLMIWLTPGMNIHRSPLCGRNFEYFSEDPFITGKMAAAKVRGIQSRNVVATPKHFACNNKETNRRDCDSVVSERALREIYLKGFEICVKEAEPRLIMTSYNLINGERASEHYEMITGILRNEWKYQGAVTTDWSTFGYHTNEMFAGNDIRMPHGYGAAIKDWLVGEREKTLGAVQTCAKRVLQMLLNF